MKNNNKINIKLIISYLFLRIIGSPILLLSDQDWLIILIELMEYTIITILIIRNVNQLRDYNMSFISAFIIAIFGSILRPSIGTTAEGKLLELLFWCPAFILVVFLFRNIKKFKGINNSSLIWGFFSIVLPIFLGLFFAAIRIIIDGQNPVLNSDILSIISVIGLQLPFQMSHAAIIEEPVFRGFLWGTLNNIGWKENRIFILVFLMFILAHLSYIGRPFTFFFALPIITFFLNYIILKSHSITNSMIFHTVINTMTAVSYYLIAVFF